MPVIAQNVERHPSCWPSSVPNGTPSTFAVVRPANIIAMAPALRSGATRFAATTEPMPKNAPCVRAASTRPPIMTAYVGASAETRLPAMKSTISAVRTCLRLNRVTAAVRPMAPTATLRRSRDQPAGCGFVDREAAGDVGQQPGDDELGEPDPEAPDGEGEQGEWHGKPFLGDRGRG